MSNCLLKSPCLLSLWNPGAKYVGNEMLRQFQNFSVCPSNTKKKQRMMQKRQKKLTEIQVLTKKSIQVMRLVKPVNYWKIAIIYSQINLIKFVQSWRYNISYIVSIIYYISVACPEASRHWYTVWAPKLCAQSKEKLVQNNINYLIISSL